jgi:hypothetical protein
MLFDYPDNAAFGRVLPKSKIYEHAKPGAAIKRLFVQQVDRIVWQYKLAPETINVPRTRAVPEIQIFSIDLKDGNLKQDVLRCIDKAIPFPILFEVRHGDETKTAAAYKRTSEADSSKWVISEYFESRWFPVDAVRAPLPMTLDLEALYTKLLNPLMPFPPRQGESLQQHVARMELAESKQREIEKCESRLDKEKQFNRKVEINAELRIMKQELDSLIRPLPVSKSAMVR